MQVSLAFLNLHDAVQTLFDFLQPHCEDLKQMVQVQPTNIEFFTRFGDRRQRRQLWNQRYVSSIFQSSV